ncbi:hypothetical protein B0O99DRAFT_503521 [Bisporella sp. PMI_857]|nr:hypothetical protein B0O99DRAFT_503521 [Bisporella sp. PMI_857]
MVETLKRKGPEQANNTDGERTVRARRASKPKVKTGCNNCKLRRVKCDETRPQCTKCVRSGRHCDGFPAVKRTLDVAIPIAPRPAPAEQAQSPQITKKIIRKPLPPRPARKSQPTPPATPVKEEEQPLSATLYQLRGFSLNQQEGQYFQIFRTKTAGELSGFFDSEFWTRSVLQESHSEASIRHAVVALGALYKTLEKMAESPPGSPEANPTYHVDSATSHYNFALQQYSNAVTRLRESIGSNEIRSNRTILMSIVLFTCFQSFTGDHKAAITQIQSGLGLLEERRQDSRQPLVRRQGDVVEDELVQMFTRLAVQAKSYDMAFHFPEPYVIQLSPKSREPLSPDASPSSPDVDSDCSLDSHIPEVFANTQEAREALDSLCERIMRFKEQLSNFYPAPGRILPASIISSGAGFKRQLEQWGAAFEPLFKSRRNQGNTERAGINVLKMISIMTTILFVMGYSMTEMGFDNFMGPFREIVELANEVVVDEELSLAAARCGDSNNCRHKRAHGMRGFQDQFVGLATQLPLDHGDGGLFSHIKASFALDIGIVAPLFVVATKCRDRKLRREAIRLLMSSPRREGMWDSILCGKVSQWIMEVEEEGLRHFEPWDPVGANEMVPEANRVMVKQILFDLQKREAALSCGTRGTADGAYDPRTRETQIYW